MHDLAAPAFATPPHAGAPAVDALARQAAGGDAQAFERLYRLTVARVHSLARRILGRSHADEATQEVYLRAWRGISTWRGDASAATWLHRLAVNVILNERARKDRELEAGAIVDDAAAHGSRDAHVRLDLEAAIETLPPGARAVYVLHDVEGLRHDEIAQRLSISMGTSKSQLHRARMLLRTALWSDHHHE